MLVKNLMLKQYSETQISKALLVLIILGSLAFTALMVSQGIWMDDAFISFRYAKNLLHGLGLVFNRGEHVEGYTNFLWTMISYLGLRLGFEAIDFAQVVSMGAQAITLWAVFRLGICSGLSRYRSLIAPLFLAFSPGFVSYPAMGMETTFFTMLVTLAALGLASGLQATRKGSVMLGVTLLSIALARFDGFGLVFIMLGYGVLVTRDIKRLLPAGLVFMTGWAVYNLWRLSYYPTPLPNTFYAKVGFSFRHFEYGLIYLYRFAANGGHVVLGLALAPFLMRRASATARIAGWVAGWHFVYIFIVGGDWMPYFRFIMPVVPLLLFLMQEGIWALFERSNNILRLKWRNIALAGVTGLLFVLFVARPLAAAISSNELLGSFFRAEDAAKIGRYLDKALDCDHVVAMEWAGIVPYFMHTQQRVLDSAGLTDRDVTLHDFPRYPMGTLASAEYISGRGPELIALCARVFPSFEAAVSGANLRIQALPAGTLVHEYYHKLISPKSAYRLGVMTLGEGEFWPVLVHKKLAQSKLFLFPKENAFLQAQKNTGSWSAP